MREKKLSLRQLLSIVALVFWMGVIFFMSAQSGDESMQTSNKTMELVTKITEKVFPSLPHQPSIIKDYIRIAGHFTEYFILGLLSFNFMRAFKLKLLKSLGLGVLFCMVYAASDEIHQLFVAGRACELSDWLVDVAGAGTGCLLLLTIHFISSKYCVRRLYIN